MSIMKQWEAERAAAREETPPVSGHICTALVKYTGPASASVLDTSDVFAPVPGGYLKGTITFPDPSSAKPDHTPTPMGILLAYVSEQIRVSIEKEYPRPGKGPWWVSVQSNLFIVAHLYQRSIVYPHPRHSVSKETFIATLYLAFLWECTPQGYEYWDDAMNKVCDTESP